MHQRTFLGLIQLKRRRYALRNLLIVVFLFETCGSELSFHLLGEKALTSTAKSSKFSCGQTSSFKHLRPLI